MSVFISKLSFTFFVKQYPLCIALFFSLVSCSNREADKGLSHDISFVLNSKTTISENFTSVEQGFYSANGYYKDGKIMAFYDMKNFEKAYRQLKKDKSPIVVPIIDFNNHIVVISIDKVRGSTGYSLETRAVELIEPKRILIKNKYTYPHKNAVVGMALTKPYHIIAIKKK